MKITFVSNYINHHQIPFSEVMYEKLGSCYCFIQTEPMEQERVEMGWGLRTGKIPYLRLYYEKKVECDKLLLESDIVIFGGTEQEEILKPRLSLKKPVIRYSERLYREGQWKAVSPRGLIKKYMDHTKYRREEVYLLCSGAYVASDFQIIKAYPKKMMKWGYFPQTKQYDVDNLLNEKDTDFVSLLWAGRFLPLKHPEYAVYAAKELQEKGYRIHLEMIGDGEMMPEMKALIAKYNLESVVTLKGFQTPETVRFAMERANIFLFTSNHLEGWGAVLNEAMNSGCGVVTEDRIGAVPFLVKHGENGMVYREGDRAEFLKYVELLVTDKELRNRLGKNAYQTIQKEWNARQAAERLLTVCRQILAGNLQMPKTGPCSRADIIAPGKGYGYTRK